MLTSEAVYQFVELARAEDIAVIKQAVVRLQAALKDDDAFEQLAATNALFGAISITAVTRCWSISSTRSSRA